ncbi:4'-phosphopantetheinyl transferase superfamily protein [Desulfobulbus rhabdoformis]|uniref:4'-phosphopantetheinyl transferase superfamily protein n=1 Tax=Desulfobulbus rhabdoformis TaxID=34032 RepID=UPI001963C6E7|nr:4'-phosphopantetheinyl transferase superfamily protein [Desulfobulbus rhabdoformis]
MEMPQVVDSLFRAELLPASLSKEFSLCPIDLNLLTMAMQDTRKDTLVQALLAPREQDIFTGFSYQKRRIEWLGGRLAAKKALCQHTPGLGNWNAISILPQEHGQPGVYLSGQKETAVQISISHSADYAVAGATSSVNCGVDIQQFSDGLLRVRERFATAEEIALLQDEPESICRLGLLWSAKEALKKCFFVTDSSFFGHIRLVQAEKTETHCWRFQCALEQAGQSFAHVQVVKMKQYALAVVRGGFDARITRG